MGRKRKKRKPIVVDKKTLSPNYSINPIPKILGGTFDSTKNNVDYYQELINNAPKRDRKIRIIFETECSVLKTGFSTHIRELFKRLYKTGKYELAELGCIKDPYAQVQMANGATCPISLVKIDDEVITHTGKIQKVTQVSRKEYKGKIIKLSREGFSGKTLELTENHPVLICKKENAQKKYKSSKHGIKWGLYKSNPKWEWISAGDISIGDFVAYSIPDKQNTIQSISINGITVPLNDDFAFLSGWFLAEGYVGKNNLLGLLSVGFCCNLKEEHLAKKIVESIKSIFNIDCKYHKRPDMGVYEIKVSNRLLARTFACLFGTSCYDKFINHQFTRASKDFIFKMFAAYTEGDGSSNKDRNDIVTNTCSYDIANDFAKLLINYGVDARLRKNKNKNGYSIIVRGKDAEKICKFWTYKHNDFKKTSHKRGYFEKDNLRFYRVSQVHKKEWKGKVYNLEVANDNSYMVNNFVVHNSYISAHDPRITMIPWKVYPVLPSNNVEQEEFNKDARENQFGKYKFNYAVADFKPDIVISNRDHWMSYWIKNSPLRKNFLWFWQPTVDGYPQKWEWIRDYSTVDGLFTYSWFGKKVLEDQSRLPIAQKRYNIPPLNVVDVMQAGSELDIFKPMNKDDVKRSFNIPTDKKFVGTVMRNQPRKLFPRIIESFAIFKRNYPKESDNVYLLLHTSVPDVGWDIEEEICRNDLARWVVFSYLCTECHNVVISSFIGSPAQCPICKTKNSFRTPNTQIGFPDYLLASVYNLMDIYIQGSIAEGCAYPVQEARACGVPCLVSDYSALYEKARNGGALPIKDSTIYTESETMQWRSLFSRRDLADKMALLLKDDNYRNKLAREARQCAVKYYNWDLMAKKWEAYIDNAEIKDRKDTWEAPLDIKWPAKERAPAGGSDQEFITWCYLNILRRSGVDGEGMQHWSKVLANGGSRDQLEDFFRNLVENENKTKMFASKPHLSNPNPVEKIAAQIEELENAT